MKKDRTQRGYLVRNITVLVWVGVLLIPILVIESLGPIYNVGNQSQVLAMQTSRIIDLCLFQYSVDHNGNYPVGKTSTEVFQQLLDGKYVTDPALFYVAMPGKVKPQGTQLKPENVSFDVTCCVDSSSPDGLPLVFLTGYKVTYAAGARAIPEVKGLKPFIAVCYKSNSARVTQADEDGSIPNFVPSDFQPDGKTYRQLTP